MNLSCCTWALSGPDEEVLNQIATIGFQQIDIQPHTFNSDASLAKMNELNLSFACMAVSFGVPPGLWDSANEDDITTALEHAEKALVHANSQQITTAYIIPELDESPEALARFARSLATLADRAAVHNVKLCVEHFPGRALPTIAGTLDFLHEIGHPNLYLLLDIGHAQMSNESSAEAIVNAGDRLGYVHLDDNDGEHDLHWSLLDGVLTEASLHETFAALDNVGYQGGISLELSPQLADPYEALVRSWNVVQGGPR